ncbi:MAG: DoxX family protein [Labilithrix sp.]|nr:DoxX family protein [Labilithrix sp.]MCW5831172.1 DoxX family protein [Labilithrix sp.]
MSTLTSTEHRNGSARPTPLLLWTGRVLNALPLLALTMSATFKLSHSPQFVEMWTGKLGWPEGALTTIGLLELAIVAVHLVPRTALVGAVLITAYLGGAVAAHVRIGDAFAVPVILGLLLWTGFTLRDERVRALVLPRKP